MGDRRSGGLAGRCGVRRLFGGGQHAARTVVGRAGRRGHRGRAGQHEAVGLRRVEAGMYEIRESDTAEIMVATRCTLT
ncbi:MAG: hypothetical protein ACKOC8_09505, partial [Pirellulales bacterium]